MIGLTSGNIKLCVYLGFKITFSTSV